MSSFFFSFKFYKQQFFMDPNEMCEKKHEISRECIRMHKVLKIERFMSIQQCIMLTKMKNKNLAAEMESFYIV